jgi:ribonuclease D
LSDALPPVAPALDDDPGDESGEQSPAPVRPYEPREGVPAVITDADSLGRYAALLAQGTGPLALDAERASGYRYSQRAYLVQIRRVGAGTALIDPIAVPDLSPVQDATEGVEWILHAATQDLPCLAEVGLRPTRLFDTELAGRLLGRERVSLAALVQSELGEVIEKGHGATDWSIRPLTAAQLRYAALDVELLVELRDAMDEALHEAGKDEIARQEFESLLSFTPRERGEDEWRRTSGIHRIRKPRTLAVVRALWHARDEIAQERDIAVGRILPDASIVAAAQAAPTSVSELAALKEFNGRGAHRYLSKWWAAIAAAEALPVSELPASSIPAGGPPPPRSWSDRDPDAFARLSAARTALSALAEGIGMPVENLMSPDAVRRLCWTPPDPLEPEAVGGYLASLGARPWQVEICLPDLCRCLAETAPPNEVTGE